MRDGAEKIIEDCFNRAGSCPLFFSVCGDMTAEADAISVTLRRRAHQLESVAIRADQQQLGKLVGIGPFPLLKKLAINMPLLGSSTTSFRKSEFFNDAPRLTRLYFGTNITPSMFSFPWTTLSNFTCANSSGDEFLKVLKLVPSLTAFTCRVTHGKIMHRAVITHERLQNLCLTDRSSTQFLPFVRLPALQNLVLHVADAMDNDSLFSILPGLTEIELHDLDEDFVLNFLARLDRTQDPEFLPRLQSLRFGDCTQFPVGILVQALSSRYETRDGMTELLVFQGTCFPGEEIYISREESDTLRELVAGGMVIHLGPEGGNQI
ncbi:hypothetical protein B0H17DRAFT_1182099 [Mycena rosella]|uniref:Uncharacterized protein n=1 Tax=Mycena rosella TaxID=1033263 RepID=A0AAD7G9R0_MYCRO|nr:hypothetical protein B0H17DRAFT_1182099 [Mycena rosella]